MARVTIEDCLKHVENRFDLVLKASKRARDLQLGGVEATVPLDNDKPTVVALREIAAGNDITRKPVEALTEENIFIDPAQKAMDEVFGEQTEAAVDVTEVEVEVKVETEPKVEAPAETDETKTKTDSEDDSSDPLS